MQVAADSLQPALELSLAQRWIDTDPRGIDALRAAATAALSLDEIAQSAAYYRKIIIRAPGGVEAAFGALTLGIGDAEDIHGARQVADRLTAYFPGSAAALRLQGYAALRADDPAAAVHSFTAALPGTDGAARRELIDALRRARVLAGDAAAPLAESLAEVERTHAPADRFDYALLLIAAKRDAQARVQLHELLRVPQFTAQARRILGLMDFHAGDYNAARRQFGALLSSGRYLDDAFYYLGLIAERHGDLERAIRNYARVQDGDEAVPALLRAAAILHAHGAAATADPLLDQLLAEQPAYAPEILAARADIDMQSGAAQRALDLLDRAIQRYPDSAELHYARASLNDERGHLGAALRELTAILKARPTDPVAMNALGYTLADHGRHLSYARKLIERAHAAAPKDAAIGDSLGWVLYRQGHAAEALAYLTSAYADEPGGDIGAHLGEVLWQRGRHTQAEHIWLQAAAIDPDDRLLRATRDRLRAMSATGG